MTALRVVAAVITDQGRIFACRRAGKSAAGKWEFPGGKVDAGEAPEAALVREIHEELGVRIQVGPLLHRASTPVGDVVIDLACYRASLNGEAPLTSTDHDDLRWLLPSELRALDWAEPDIPAVTLLIAGA